MPTDPLVIELTAPQTLNGRRLRHQSLWFLVRLLWARIEDPDAPLVRRDDLLGHVSEAANARMLVSRAFRDLDAVGVRLGWGERADRDPRFLNPDRRSQGPFWLSAADAARIDCRVGDAPAGEDDIRAFLGLDGGRGMPPGPTAGLLPPESLRFWRAFLGATVAMREGRLADLTHRATTGAGALGGLRSAQAEARGDFQRAFATLGEAMVWRRLGDHSLAHKLLRRLRTHRRQSRIIGNDYLEAMEGLVAAWCAYDQRDLRRAEALLAEVGEGEARAALLRHHPLVRYEWHNLAGLLRRAQALAAVAGNRPQATAEAHLALEHFDHAFAAALESTATDPVQRVAANLGITLWLLRRAGLGDGDEAAARDSAVRWIALSEWLSRTGGTQLHSAWNAIALMRIARAGVPVTPDPAPHRRHRPLTIAEMTELAEPFGDAFSPEDWPRGWGEAAALRIARHECGEHRYSRAQLCALLFERAWFALNDGAEEDAVVALDRLRAALPLLPDTDRRYFASECLSLLPEEFRLPIN